MNAKPLEEFDPYLDELLGLDSKQVPSKEMDPHTETALQIASRLHQLDLEAEIAPRSDIRSRWVRHFQQFRSHDPNSYLLSPRIIWGSALIIIFLMLLAFHQPVFASIGNVFGYVYIPEIGFLPMDSTYVLEQPISQQRGEQTVTVTRGVATPEAVTLFLKFNDVARPVDDAWIETSSNERIELLQWGYWPNTVDSQGVRMIFATLPPDTNQITLALPEGWRLPLTWIASSQSSLPNVRVVPYADSLQGSVLPDVCTEQNSLTLCVLAAITSAEETSILIQARTNHPSMTPGDIWSGLLWQTETDPVTLQDERGNRLLMTGERNGSLIFSSLQGTQKVTLTVPAVLASAGISEQSIVVDVGSNPQPGTIIPLDINIEVLGIPVHFSKATFVGDGINSLRLTLNADEPIPSIDGLTPAALQIGKPNQVDDLYGSGMLEGSKDIFVELIRPNGKITGELIIPIVGATVIVQGPFELTFSLQDGSITTPTLGVTNPDDFHPAPTSTPPSLDSYFHSGQTLMPGDLLYSVWKGNQSDIYRFNPSSGEDYGLFMTLPGHVSSFHIYPDRNGLDYLTGKYNPTTNNIDGMQLYTVGFTDTHPRLLHTTPEGALFWPAWSYDAHILALAVQLTGPGETMPRLGWVDMSCRVSGECPIQILDVPSEYQLNRPKFSPEGKWLVIPGVDAAGGTGEIYILPFDDHDQPGILQNLTNTNLADERQAYWSGYQAAWKCPSDLGNDSSMICMKDILSGMVTSPTIILNNDNIDFGLSDTGNYFWQTIINRKADREQQLWLYTREGAGQILSSSPWFDSEFSRPTFSQEEKFLAFVSSNESSKTEPDTLHIVNVDSGQEIFTFEIGNSIGWLDWVR